ncbi:hypothetical protein BH18VER1_BH18VER1_15460 [soil metagenome]
MSLLNQAAADTGLLSQPTDLAFSDGNGFLYNLLRGTGGVAGFRVTSSGALAPLGTYGVGKGLPIANGASGLVAY